MCTNTVTVASLPLFKLVAWHGVGLRVIVPGGPSPYRAKGPAWRGCEDAIDVRSTRGSWVPGIDPARETATRNTAGHQMTAGSQGGTQFEVSLRRNEKGTRSPQGCSSSLSGSHIAWRSSVTFRGACIETHACRGWEYLERNGLARIIGSLEKAGLASPAPWSSVAPPG